MKKVHLECSCCGGYAGRFEQFWNQDDGYGVCTRCVDDIIERGEEYMAFHGIDINKTWGLPDVHRAPASHESKEARAIQ